MTPRSRMEDGGSVYVCISEEVCTSSGSYDPPEPPEYGSICEIVVARSHAQARYLAWKADRSSRGATMADMPRFTVRKIGDADGPARILPPSEANPWWAKVPDNVMAFQ